MMRIIRLAVLPLIALVAGLAAGQVLELPRGGAADADAASAEPEPVQVEHLTLPGQFVIPLMEDGRVAGHMVLTLGVSYGGDMTEVNGQAPRLRDVINEALFVYASLGGFRGDFTEAARMNTLRFRLNEAAAMVLGEGFRSVLIEQILRREA